jgi:hypothetical protein
VSDAPIAFVSHASEDKQRFVRPLAAKLREMGIDAWLDEWEIAGGDSLVDQIFNLGIEKAAAFVVVLSTVSVTKPWVREELDAAVVRRIESNARLIPVRLDPVDVPAALKHLKWIDATDGDVDKAADEIARSIFGVSAKPPLGDPPAYTTHVPALISDPVDDLVLAKLIEVAFEKDDLNISSDELFAALAPHGLSREAITESAEVLASKGFIERQNFMGGGFALRKLNSGVILAVLPSRGVEVEQVSLHLLGHIANHRSTSGFELPSLLTRTALIDHLESNGWIKVGHRIMGGNVFAEATAAGTRTLRQV